MISTSCRFCEFRQTSEDGCQTGCELDLINRYKDVGVESELKEFKDERGEGKAFELQAFCLFRRPPGWKKAKENELVDGLTFEDIAKTEINFDTTFVVMIKKGQTFEDVLDFVYWTNQMSVRPKKILFLNFAHIKPILFLQLNGITTDVQWGMEFMLHNQEKEEILRKSGNDLGAKKVKTSYFVALDLNQRIELDYLEVVKDRILNQLDRFVAIINDEGKPNFYQTAVFRHVRGNEQAPANDKIRWLAEDQECLFLLKNNNEIFQYQKSL